MLELVLTILGGIFIKKFFSLFFSRMYLFVPFLFLSFGVLLKTDLVVAQEILDVIYITGEHTAFWACSALFSLSAAGVFIAFLTTCFSFLYEYIKKRIGSSSPAAQEDPDGE